MKRLFFLCFCSCVLPQLAAAQSGAEKSTNLPKQEFLKELLARMTLEEKIGQLTLYTSGWDITGPTLNENYKNELREGKVGALFNAHGVAYNRELQDLALSETRLGIPLLFGYDVIHGYQTIFPTPLGESSSWDMQLIEESARLMAKEAAAAGLNWTFNPMVDISIDPRWGRVMEGAGEDPYLGSAVARAKVKGYQGKDLADPSTLLACVKHYAAYGAPRAGRDYGTVELSERTLRETYLPPYHAAVDAGVASVMTSFNEVNGVPATANAALIKGILRGEWGFDGFVVTDYTAINELVAFGVAANEAEAAELALDAGVDMDMQGGVYNAHAADLLTSGKISEAQIDSAAYRILEAKWDAGLFADPYRYLDEKREKAVVRSQEMRDHALRSARESIVLLKNDTLRGAAVLPLEDEIGTIALIGPLAENQIDLMGAWHASGRKEDVVTLRRGIEKVAPGVELLTVTAGGFYDVDTSNFAAARAAAAKADILVLALGEDYQQSGEAASRSDLTLPGGQELLVREMLKYNKPVIALIAAGRPLVLTELEASVPAIVNTWQLGTMHGQAVAEVLFGRVNPSGKLTMSFPRNVGQVPLSYNEKRVGRPVDVNQKYTSKYIDVPNTPLYPFGYGLSYTSFAYSDLELSAAKLGEKDTLHVRVKVSNTGPVAGEEVVQLYVQDHVATVTRPLRELKGFEKVALEPGESRVVSIAVPISSLAFYTRDMTFEVEPGTFTVYVGGDSSTSLGADFEVQ